MRRRHYQIPLKLLWLNRGKFITLAHCFLSLAIQQSLVGVMLNYPHTHGYKMYVRYVDGAEKGSIFNLDIYLSMAAI